MASGQGSHWLIESTALFHLCITNSPDICVNHVPLALYVSTMFHWHCMCQPCSIGIVCVNHVPLALYVSTMFHWHCMCQPCSIGIVCVNHVPLALYVSTMFHWHCMCPWLKFPIMIHIPLPSYRFVFLYHTLRLLDFGKLTE